MKLYHGSKYIIDKPTFGKGKPYNDYGLGFYCTENIDMAKEWAVGPEIDGYANSYSFNAKSMSILNLNNKKYCILHWLAILVNNRIFDTNSALAQEAKAYITNNFMLPYEDFDIIKGYRADDSYFAFASDFLNGTISYRQLYSAMKLGNLGMQFVLKSKKAFEQIQFINADEVEAATWYPRRASRDSKARKEYWSSKNNKLLPDDIFILDIIKNQMKEGDARLR